MTEPPSHREGCPICGSGQIDDLGTKLGKLEVREFIIRQCRECGFTFVSNPSLNFERLYSEPYYNGKGVDPSVDYVFELNCPKQTIRSLEWRGITEVISNLRGSLDRVRWLDFGCGNGGLVRYLREMGVDAFGFEEGWIAGEAARCGIPILTRSDIDARRGEFDVVTAIEVLEHVPDPLSALRDIRAAMTPGGLFFATTGNSAPISNILGWHYLLPEIHCSLFQPQSLAHALERTGFRAHDGRFVAGWEKIYAFKVLKKFGLRKLNPAVRSVPWSLVAQALDRKFQLSRHPTGTAV